MTDFNDTLDELIEEPELLSLEFGSKITAAQYNEIFNSIEAELTKLYERMRLLEDVKDYCREYILKEIQDKKETFQKRLKTIEHAADSFQESGCVAYAVNLNSPVTEIFDRNGDSIQPMFLGEGNLCNFDKATSTAVISNVMREGDCACYNSTSDNLTDNKSCRSLYLLEEFEPDGVREDYEISFATPTLCNYIDVDVVNCDIENLSAVLEDDTILEIDSPNVKRITESTITGINFTLHCKNYKIESTLQNFDDYDAFNKIDSGSYERKSNEIIVHDIVNKNNVNNSRRYQDDFVLDFANWQDDNDIADKLNLRAWQGGGNN